MAFLALQDFTEDVNCAFEFLLKLTPLLDKADQRCKYELPCPRLGSVLGSPTALPARHASKDCLTVHPPGQEQEATAA